MIDKMTVKVVVVGRDGGWVGEREFRGRPAGELKVCCTVMNCNVHQQKKS